MVIQLTVKPFIFVPTKFCVFKYKIHQINSFTVSSCLPVAEWPGWVATAIMKSEIWVLENPKQWNLGHQQAVGTLTTDLNRQWAIRVAWCVLSVLCILLYVARLFTLEDVFYVYYVLLVLFVMESNALWFNFYWSVLCAEKVQDVIGNMRSLFCSFDHNCDFCDELCRICYICHPRAHGRLA